MKKMNKENKVNEKLKQFKCLKCNRFIEIENSLCFFCFNKKEQAILRVIMKDIEMLVLDYKEDDNAYYYKLIKGNIKDLLKGK